LVYRTLETIKESPRKVDLLNLTPSEFEHLVRELFIQMGYEVTTQSLAADAGIDFILSRNGISGETTVAIAKRWRGPVGVSLVQQLAGAVLASNANAGLLVTTGTFTRQAQDFAERLPVTLVDGEQLIQLLAQFGYHTRIGEGGNERSSG
jgi:restriction system protein